MLQIPAVVSQHAPCGQVLLGAQAAAAFGEPAAHAPFTDIWHAPDDASQHATCGQVLGVQLVNGPWYVPCKTQCD
jgi:hypothetical protein